MKGTGWGVTFAAEPLHAGEASGTGGVCDWGEESFSPPGSRGPGTPTVLSMAREPQSRPPRALPMSQRSQGLPQAVPSVAQHSERRVAPCRLASQRPSWIFSQQVPLVLSVGRGRLAHLAGPHLHNHPRRPRLPLGGRLGPGCSVGPLT